MGSWRGAWADVGAGRGTFTRALASLLGSEGVVYALDNDPAAVEALRRLAEEAGNGEARIVPFEGDMHALGEAPELEGVTLDGALLANVLHYASRPEDVLRGIAPLLTAGGRVVVVEYDRRKPNPWVPWPLPPGRLGDAAALAGFSAPEVVSRRPSAWQREMYCAVLAHEGGAGVER